MGKRRLPLKQAYESMQNAKIAKNSESTQKAKLAKNAEVEDDEDAYWERKEKEAQGMKATGLGSKEENNGDNASEEESASSDSDSSDSEESDEGIALDRKVEHISEEYTFEFNDMRESFTEGITTLLKSKLIPNPTSAYEVACSVSSQTAVGTAIVCEGGDDVFAFATVLPLVRQNAGALQQTLQGFMKALDSSKFSKSENARMMRNCIDGSQRSATGLLLHQRFYNLPPPLIVHLHRNLNEDLGWAQGLSESVDGSGDGSSADDHTTFKAIKNVLLIAPCTMTADLEANKGSSKKRKLDKGKVAANESGAGAEVDKAGVEDVTGSTRVIFDNFEDEVYFQEATCSFTFKPVGSNSSSVGTLVTVALLPASSIKTCVKGIAQLITEQ